MANGFPDVEQTPTRWGSPGVAMAGYDVQIVESQGADRRMHRPLLEHLVAALAKPPLVDGGQSDDRR